MRAMNNCMPGLHPGTAAACRGCLAAVLAVMACAAGAQTIYVDVNTGDDARTGLGDWTNAVKTISNGVAQAGASGTVLVATGVYDVAENVTVASGINLRSWNNGAFDPENTIIDGQCDALPVSEQCRRAGQRVYLAEWQWRRERPVAPAALLINNGVISNCHVVNNRANQYGGGIYMGSVNAGVENCIIEGNTVTNEGTARGGGVYIAGGGGTLRNSTLAYNTNLSTAVYAGGGGVYVRGDGADGRCHVIGWISK